MVFGHPRCLFVQLIPDKAKSGVSYPSLIKLLTTDLDAPIVTRLGMAGK